VRVEIDEFDRGGEKRGTHWYQMSIWGEKTIMRWRFPGRNRHSHIAVTWQGKFWGGGFLVFGGFFFGRGGGGGGGVSLGGGLVPLTGGWGGGKNTRGGGLPWVYAGGFERAGTKKCAKTGWKTLTWGHISD